MSRKVFTFDPTLLDRTGVDAFKKPDAQVQRRMPPTFTRVRRIATAMLLVALLAGLVILARLLHYMPASELEPVIEHLKLWK
jgi:hypothetical protein